MKRWLVPMGLLLVLGLVTGCASVKPYQKMMLNDEDMQLGPSPLEHYENNYQSYREGASGGMGGKVGGGCGCN